MGNPEAKGSSGGRAGGVLPPPVKPDPSPWGHRKAQGQESRNKSLGLGSKVLQAGACPHQCNLGVALVCSELMDSLLMCNRFWPFINHS